VTRVSARGTFAWCVAAAALAAAGAARAQAPAEAAPYTVECGPDADEGGATTCRVDRATYVGWRTFHGICHTCHAQDAVGSTFAPDLLVRMRQIGKPEFMKALAEGFKGQVGVMPPWSQDPNVSKYFEELWSYLKARSDGALMPGRPKRLPAEP
jgi:cytochrome c5